MTPPPAVVFPDNPGALAAARELGLAGIPVFVLGPVFGPAAHSRFTTFVETPNLYQEREAWLQALLAWADQHAAAASGNGNDRAHKPVLIPTEDAACLTVDHYYDLLEPHFTMPFPGPGILSGILDKRQLHKAALKCGVGTPKQREVHSAEDVSKLGANGWLVKPSCRYVLAGDGIKSFREETGGTKAIAGDPAIAAKTVLDAGFPTILQQAVPGGYERLITAALVIGKDGKLIDFFLATKECEYPEPFGDGLIVRIVPGPGVIDRAVAVLAELGYWGICDVEFKQDTRDLEFKLLDANPRPWLWLGLGTRAGRNLLLHAYRIATGVRVKPPKLTGTRPTKWVSLRGTLAFLTRCYRPSRHGVILPFRLAFGALSTSLADWRTFRDPLYLRPAAWPNLLATLTSSPPREPDHASTTRDVERKAKNSPDKRVEEAV